MEYPEYKQKGMTPKNGEGEGVMKIKAINASRKTVCKQR